MFKRFISGLTALLLITAFIPLPAYADTTAATTSASNTTTTTTTTTPTIGDDKVKQINGYYEFDGIPIVNKSYGVTLSYVPESWYILPSEYYDSSAIKFNNGTAEVMQMEWNAGQALERLLKNVRSDRNKGYPNASILVTYMDNSMQNSYKDNATYKDTALSATPGNNEFQLGMSAVINLTTDEAYNYLKNKAHDFGFLIRYPKGKESNTGFSDAGITLRYIGEDATSKSLCEKLNKAGTSIEEHFGISSEYGKKDNFPETTSNAEDALSGAAQENAENEIEAEKSELDGMSQSQKESYMIMKTKFMTETELAAMEWNLVMSQFAVPYKENIQDVWNHKSWKDIRDQGLVIDDNPYLTMVQNNLRALPFDDVLAAIDLGIDLEGNSQPTVKSQMDKIAEVMLEGNEVFYSPLYTEHGDLAYVTDLFNSENSVLTVRDKYAVTGNAVSKTEMWDALKQMQEDYLIKAHTKEELASAVQSGSNIFDVTVPVWANTDGTMLYNAIFVANAIRINGYGNYTGFLKSCGNSQLFIDRWGNICAQIRINNEPHMCIVYPAYANPMFTSTEPADDAIIGYVYDDFENSAMWSGTEDSGFTINKKSVLKTQEDFKTKYLSQNITTLKDNDYLGTTDSLSRNYDIAKRGDGTAFGGAFNRKMGEFNQSRDLIPIIELDNTTNMIFNKAILASYTRDSYSYVTGKTNEDGLSSAIYAKDWYSCLSDRNTSYSSFALTEQYNANSKEALFSNSIVFDKYYVSAIFGVNSKTYDYGPHAVAASGDPFPIDVGNISLRVLGWGYDSDSGEFVANSSNSDSKTYFHTNASNTNGVKIIDTAIPDKTVITMYPFMQMHTYRKGLYSDQPSLQPTKQKGWTLNALAEDKYVANSWKYENTVSLSSDTHNNGTYAYNEVVWDAMYSDSDKYKTYVIFNYTDKVVPSNSSIYGLGHRFTKDSQGKVYYISVYLDSILKDDKSKKDTHVVGKTYMSIPLFDGTIDDGSQWSIWNSTSSGLVDSVQTGVRTRTLSNETEKMSVKVASKKDGGLFFEPVEITASGQATALRYILNDQRVSDVLESYPKEDVTLLSFVWRNYYTPQTVFRTKLNKIIKGKSDEAPGGDTEETTEATSETEPAATTVTVTNTPTSTAGDTTVYDYYLDNDKSIIPAINNESYFDKSTVLTPYNIICEDGSLVNNTIIWTNACSREQQNKLSPGNITVGNGYSTGIGEVPTLTVSHTYINRVSYNVGELLLSVNKNTEGDNLINLVSGFDTDKEFNTDNILSAVEAFFTHPVISFATILMGFCQFIHNNVAVGNIGNVFDISWIVDKAKANNVVRFYIIISAAIYSIVLIIRGLRFMFNKNQQFLGIFREWSITVCLSTVPVILLNYVGLGLNVMATTMTKSVVGKMAAVEIEREVASGENLNINFEEVYMAYKEQFATIGDSYESIAIKVPKAYNEYLKEVTYETVNLKDLYDSIEYSNVLAKAKLEATNCEIALLVNGEEDEESSSTTSANILDGIQPLKDLYSRQNPGVTHLYYTYSEFVPVNYEKYSENIFYYFYDYIKYQYLAYWAQKSDSTSSTYSSAAKNFTLPDAKKAEKWSSYVARMWDAERYMLLKSYNGMYIMMHDDAYNYNKLFDNNGNPVYRGAYPTDMFGLSNLFNMTDQRYNQEGLTGIPGYQYYNAEINATSDNGEMDLWRGYVKDSFHSSVGNYYNLMETLARAERFDMTNTVFEFYPVAYLMDNPSWGLVEEYGKVIRDKTTKTNNFADYNFTPTYMWNEFKNDPTYDGYIDTDASVGLNGGNFYNYSQSDVFRFENMAGKRIPYRVYASKSSLYASTYNEGKYSKKTTPLEEKLMKCNKKAFEKIRDMTEYLQGDIRDSSLIFAAALVATMEFNKTFSSGWTEAGQIEPQSFTPETMDLDKFMRLTYATSMQEIVKNTDVMYMIYEHEGGILTALIVAATEVCIFITMIARIGVLLLLFLGCAFICVSYSFHKFEMRQQILIGLFLQLLQVFASQFLLILIITQSMNWISDVDNAIARIVISLLSLIICIAMARWCIYMFMSLFRDFKNFGGAIIQGGIQSLTSRVKSAFSEIQNNQAIKNVNAMIKNAGYSDVTPEVVGAPINPVEMRRERNARRIDNKLSGAVDGVKGKVSGIITNVKTGTKPIEQFDENRVRNSKKAQKHDKPWMSDVELYQELRAHGFENERLRQVANEHGKKRDANFDIDKKVHKRLSSEELRKELNLHGYSNQRLNERVARETATNQRLNRRMSGKKQKPK